MFSNSADRPNNTNDCGLGDGRSGTGIGGIGGPLEMANAIIKGFVMSRRTCVIYQPAIGACYEHMEYASKELVSARDPWSGWIYYDAGCAVLAHFAKFSRLGWANESGAGGASADDTWRAIPQSSDCQVSGRNPVSVARHGEPSYLTLAAPDGSDISIVIVNDSALTKTYRITIDVALAAARSPLHVWQTAAALPGERYDAGWLRRIEDAVSQRHDDADATYMLKVAPWSMVTATTLNDAHPRRLDLPAADERARAVLDADSERGVLYADDFRYEGMPEVGVSHNGKERRRRYVDARGAVPRYTTDSNGAFEIVDDETRGGVLRQQIDWKHAGNTWIEGNPRTAIGDMRWMNYRVSVDVMFEPYDGRAPYALLGAREMGGDKFTDAICAYDFKLRADGLFLLRRYGDEKVRGHCEDLRLAAERAGAKPFVVGAGVWNTVALEVAGNVATAMVNGAVVARWSDDAPQSAGRVNLGSGFDHVRFSNLRVERVDGYSPYYVALIDDMHVVSWADSRTPVLVYDGDWTHENGQSMFTYMRSISRTSQVGASLSHIFCGTGIDLFGPSDGGARLDVIVDGEMVGASLSTVATQGSLRTMFRVEGLSRGVTR